MVNVHVHLYVSDLDASRAFYERFFGTAPVKVKPGYAKFLPELAPLNLALSAGQPSRRPAGDHFGVQVGSREAVVELLERVKASGIEVREEMGTDCCFANQDKFWVRDPDGLEWEVYHLNYDLEDEVAPAVVAAPAKACCTPLSRLGKIIVTTPAPSRSRRLVSEAIGTSLLLATVVGSGIMAERLAGGNVAIALLANTVATGAGLVALILAFGPIPGAHFNPAVTLVDAWQGGTDWSEVPGYLVAQVVGALAGVVLAHRMFDLPLVMASVHVRAGVGQLVSEFVATFGLLSVIWACARKRPSVTPFAVGAYITAAYWFTASTSFANPAVTIARSLTNTFAGIRPADAPAFIVAQLAGASAATVLFRWLLPSDRTTARAAARDVVMPHQQESLGPQLERGKEFR